MARVGEQRQAVRAKPGQRLEHHKPEGQRQGSDEDSLHPAVIADRLVRMRMLMDAFHHLHPTTSSDGRACRRLSTTNAITPDQAVTSGRLGLRARFSLLNVLWSILVLRSTVRTLREGYEVAGDCHGLRVQCIPGNHNLTVATFAFNEIVHD